MRVDYPENDVWRLKDNDPDSLRYEKHYSFDFSFIDSKDIKRVIKSYVWMNYRAGSLRLSTLRHRLCAMKCFNEFAGIRNITRLSDLTADDISMYTSYLKTKLYKTTNRPLTRSTQYTMFNRLRTIIYWCQTYMPDDVPAKEIFAGNEYTGIYQKLIIDFIPDEILTKINAALRKEENPYLKYGIIILQSTGMRRGDLLRLKTDCVKPHLISGHAITWFDHKNRREQKIPVPNECVIAVDNLVALTQGLRESTDDRIRDYLFIHRIKKGAMAGNVTNVGEGSVDYWFAAFVKRNNIRDSNDQFFNLKSHQFRRTLATDMFSKDVNIKIIQEVLGHASAETTTKHYADVKDNERAASFQAVGFIGDIHAVDLTVISDPSELIWFKANLTKGAAMCDGYCTKPFSDRGEICDRLLKRQKCYTCSRFITTPEYLDIHKNHLEELEKQLAENIYGEHYAAHFVSTIEILKIIIGKLEGLQNGSG